MDTQTNTNISKDKCEPCEGKIAKLGVSDIGQRINQLQGWELVDDGKKIQKKWRMPSFTAGMGFLSSVARLAEEQGHHPDVHLESYRNVRIELSTHSAGGLTDNDFRLATKIDRLSLPIENGFSKAEH